MGTALLHNHGFTASFTEHCILIGIVSVRADLTYQQGLNRMFSRSTRYDFYWPALSHSHDQAGVSIPRPTARSMPAACTTGGLTIRLPAS